MLRRALVLVACASVAAAAAVTEQDLRLVPFPKEVRLEAGRLDLGKPLVVETASANADTLCGAIRVEFERAGLRSPQLKRGGRGLALTLAPAGAKVIASAPAASALRAGRPPATSCSTAALSKETPAPSSNACSRPSTTAPGPR